MVANPIRRARRAHVLNRPLAIVAIGSAAFTTALFVDSAAAENADPPDDAAPRATIVTENKDFVVPGRARRETWLWSTGTIPRESEHVRATASRVNSSLAPPPADGTRSAAENRHLLLPNLDDVRIGGLALFPKSSPEPFKREFFERHCDVAPRACLSDGRIATTPSKGALNTLSWLSGALGAGVGAFLLVTGNRQAGAETTIKTDFFRKGAGLSIRRAW